MRSGSWSSPRPPTSTSTASPPTCYTIPDVVEAHDLHVWTITSGMDAVSVHLQVDPHADTHAVLDRARELLRDRHKINHATVQVEPTDHAGCNLVQW